MVNLAWPYVGRFPRTLVSAAEPRGQFSLLRCKSTIRTRQIALAASLSGVATRLLYVVLVVLAVGCGTIREQRATDQMLLSDAVDRAVARVEFAPLAGERVYLDTRYLQFKSSSAIATNYVVSSLRQQMVVAGCLLQDRLEDAEYIVEARIGAMGSDGHDINYGVPPSNSVNAAASLVTNSVPLPVLPEISLARRVVDTAAVKIAVFAYARETRMPVWQSGTSLARSKASGTWVLGAGPFQRGAIYEGTEFAGRPGLVRGETDELSSLVDADVKYRSPETWDPKLRSKQKQPGQLLTPNFEITAPRLEIADRPEEAGNVQR